MDDTEIKSLFADVYHRFMTLGETTLKDDHQVSLNRFVGQPEHCINTLEFNKDGYDVICRTRTELICYHHHGLMKSRSIERKVYNS
jgi:hypothetical protein